MSKARKCSKRFLSLLMSLIMVFAFSVPVLAAEFSMEETQILEDQKYSCNISSGYTDQYNQYHKITGTATCTATVQWNEGVDGWVSSAIYHKPTIYIDGAKVTVTDTGSGNKTNHVFKFGGHTLTVRLTCDAYGDATLSYTIS